LQPWVGYHTDRHPKPWLLPAGTVCTLVGILMMSVVGSFPLILLAAGLIGIGSSTFHPEASRVARLASGGRFGLAQSTQVGGNAGSAFGPCWRQRSSFPMARACGLVRSVRRVCAVCALPDQPLVRQSLESVQAQTGSGRDAWLVRAG
jgi:MFS family permease